MSMQQLIKKNPLGSGVKNIYPKTWIEGIRDKLTNERLDDILSSYNMLYLPYAGSMQDTRILVPEFLRRKGLWITYVKFDNNIVTEWYNSDKLDDVNWRDDSNWNLSLELSTVLEEYFNTSAFKNLFYNSISSVLQKLLTLDFIAPILQDFLKGLDLPNTVENYILNYLDSDEFNNKVIQYINNSLGEFLNRDTIYALLSEWLEENKDFIKDTVVSVDWETIINEYFNTEEGQETIRDAVQPQLEGILGEFFEAFRDYIADNERVIANALARHEQAITDLQN